MKVLREFARDEAGSIVVVEVIFMVLIVGIGMTAGMVFMRDSFNQELADAGLAVNNLNQSYTLTGVTNAGGDSVSGSTFDDNEDANDGLDPVNAPPPGLVMDGNAPQAEM